MTQLAPLATKDARANLIRAFKASGCAVCKVRYPKVDWSELHIDHIDPSDRPNGSVLHHGGGGTANRVNRLGTEAILAELLQCQVLCRKHHLEKHRNGSPQIEGQLALVYGSGGWHYP